MHLVQVLDIVPEVYLNFVNDQVHVLVTFIQPLLVEHLLCDIIANI